MLDPKEPVYQKALPGGLTLRTVSTQAELDRVAALSAVIHEPTAGEMTRKIFAQHPAVTGRDLVYIENDQGEVIATICLIPWTLRFGLVDLPTAELGIVGTLERYRGQGLNRVLMDYFWQRYQERGALLSIIQGIPYFYRQYGYEYAMLPLEGGWRIQPDQIPELPGPDYSVRPAGLDDIQLLSFLYDHWTGKLDLSAKRGAAEWQYLLARTTIPEAMQHDNLLVENATGGDPVGYFRVPDYHFNENLLTIDEVSDVDFYAGLAVLNHAKSLAKSRGKDGIRLYLPRNSSLVQMARSFGASDLGVYSWQVSIPDRIAFLKKLAPLLEKRLSASPFSWLTGQFNLNLYKQVIGLTFNKGRLISVAPAKEDGQTILNLPPTQFIPLVMGGRSISEIGAAFPDAYARGPWQLLVDTLFPKVDAFIATQY